jgi:hypothetical protein
MILGLFTASLGQGSAAKNASERTESGETAVLEPPAASPVSASPSAASMTAPAGAAPPAADGSQPAAKACPQCGSTEPWGVSSWCPNCFYHPRLGTAVAAPPPPDPEVRQFLPGHVAQQESYLAVLQTIPLWIHVLWLGVVGVFVLSVFETLKLPKFGYSRAVWTVVQATLGILAALAAHVITFFSAIPSMEKHGPFDLFMKPFDFWRTMKRKLPSGAWRIWMFAWGVTAAFTAIVLIGGIRYSAIFEAKSKKKDGWIKTSQIVPDRGPTIGATNG